MKKYRRLLIAIWLAIIITACRQEFKSTASVENPVIVDPPRVSMTVFTDWQEIQVIYTVRWLDGYQPLLEKAEPERMFFGEFELDPARGHKLEQRNPRKYKKENYVDLVYYLRHIGEKKGDIAIPEQTFRYIKEEPGKAQEGLEEHDVKAPGILLRFDSVLTKDADDIIDTIDFGSFREQEYMWKGLASLPLAAFGVVVFLLFRRPTAAIQKKMARRGIAPAGKETNWQEETLAPKYARILLGNELLRLQIELAGNLDNTKLHETRAMVCNELRRFFLSYVPDLGISEFSYEEVRAKISRMLEKRKRELLIILTNLLEEHEEILYRQEIGEGLRGDIGTMRKLVEDLDDWDIWLFNMRQKKQKLFARLAKLLGRAK